MKKKFLTLLSILLVLSCLLCACGNPAAGSDEIPEPGIPVETETPSDTSEQQSNTQSSEMPSVTDVYDSLPTPDMFDGTHAWVEINDSVPFFTDIEKISTEPFELYSELDNLGRCGPAYANICTELMPTEERGSIGQVKPSGWHTVKYDFVDGKYLYNRCHLIGFQLAGENANEKNLITGTRYLNIDGMLDAENMIADYVKETGNHVLYRVTPLFRGNNLLADGVLMEAWSVEDLGDGICFCIFAFNVQPGVTIDYATGDSVESGESLPSEDPTVSETGYVLNISSMKFHLPDCPSVTKIADSNRVDTKESRDQLIAEGFEPCGSCKP